jgi:hypothetical protein
LAAGEGKCLGLVVAVLGRFPCGNFGLVAVDGAAIGTVVPGKVSQSSGKTHR